MNISRVLKIIIKNLGYLSLYLLKLFIKKRNIILLESSSHYRYGGNPKYIYEYLSKNISSFGMPSAVNSPIAASIIGGGPHR